MAMSKVFAAALLSTVEAAVGENQEPAWEPVAGGSRGGVQMQVNDTLKDNAICDSIHQLDCYGEDLDHGAIYNIWKHEDCCSACAKRADCKAWTWAWTKKVCYLKTGCNDKRTSSEDFHSGISTSPGPSPRPTPGPTPRPGPTGRKGSFLVIGDWGHDPSSHGNVRTDHLQRTIAAQMLQKFKELGDVKFILNLGDSFYPTGITSKSDGKWQSRWRDIYAPELRSVPWYSVYGNHDVYDDHGCACGSSDGSQCNQLNSDIDNKDFFYMPGVNWHKEHPELGIEVVALDFNDVSEHPCTYGQASKCQSTCYANLGSRANAAKQLFYSRKGSSSQPNLVVFSHYPTDYFRNHHTDMLSALQDGSKPITYFGGHRHNTDQNTASIAPNNNWVVGGCGGWSCDGGNQGFVVGEVSSSVKTYAVLADRGLCYRFMNGTNTMGNDHDVTQVIV
eukprot:TRINITY_DN74312_c0_g1_i1.p1 TRINITY_DN74312_c0_g1~~TRINITY_DN74312_c0_g1_i1.p1  ORF type:complete len:473 (+),score=75.80 TRINITY_DN74312_c0_g1_i1:79-1419(+)